MVLTITKGVLLVCTNCHHWQAFFSDEEGIDLFQKMECDECGNNEFLITGGFLSNGYMCMSLIGQNDRPN
jgi:hypothetical protein